MVVDQPLDYTPHFTVSTIQTSSEAINIIITSLLAVLILANIGSVVSKIICFTRHGTFNYNSWLRAFIFANSDDPVRMLSWLRRQYVFRDPKWTRADHRLRLRRLVWPFLARGIILVVSVVSVAVTLPSEKVLDGCAKHDYSLRWNEKPARFTSSGISICLDIPLDSNLGNVHAKASYCQVPNSATLATEQPADTARLMFARNETEGNFRFELGYGDSEYSKAMYVEWTNPSVRNVAYRSSVSDLDVLKGSEIAVSAIRSIDERCTHDRDASKREINGGYERYTSILNNCTLQDAKNVSETIESYLRDGLYFKKTLLNDRRVRVDLKNHSVSSVYECPLKVIVTRPLLNIAPLTQLLFAFFAVNVLVSFVVDKNGYNVFDASFHIVKEALGHDCTSNPLEENIDGKDILVVPFQKWECKGSGGGHVGYIQREGDCPVETFEENVFVGRCERAAGEMEYARMKEGAPSEDEENPALFFSD